MSAVMDERIPFQSVIDKQEKLYDSILEQIAYGESYVSEAATSIERQKNSDASVQPQHSQLLEVFSCVLSADSRLRARKAVLQRVRQEMASGVIPLDAVDWASLLDQYTTDEMKRQESKNADEARDKTAKLNQAIWDIHHSGQPMPGTEVEDEDLIVVNSSATITCPFTQLRFEHPVRNPACGHTYDRTAVMEYINLCARDGKRPQCPISGCNKPIVESTLSKDIQAERAVRAALINEASQKRRHGGTSIKREIVDDVDLELEEECFQNIDAAEDLTGTA